MSLKSFPPHTHFKLSFFFLDWKGEILEMCLCGDLHMFIQNRVFCITMLPRNRFSSVCKPEKNHLTLFCWLHEGTCLIHPEVPWVSVPTFESIRAGLIFQNGIIIVKYSFTEHIVKNAWDFFINCVITCVICFSCLIVYNNFSSICSTCSRIAWLKNPLVTPTKKEHNWSQGHLTVKQLSPSIKRSLDPIVCLWHNVYMWESTVTFCTRSPDLR